MIVPESTPVNVVKKLEKNGAEVLVHGKVWYFFNVHIKTHAMARPIVLLYMV